MINEENLDKLYQRVVDNKPLTTKELNGLGFHSKDLKDLIENESIIRVKRGIYALKSADELFFYGKHLIAQKEYDKATQCFQKCYEIDPTHSGVCFQLFLRSVKNKDYKMALEYFNVFYTNENKFYSADNNFYLYLLSMITELPENHREYAKFLKINDFRVDFNDKRYENIYLQNKIRLSAFNQRFSYALKQLTEAIKEKGSTSIQDIMTKTLLQQANEVQTKNRNKVLNLIKQEKYEDVIKFYEKMLSSHHLSISDNYTLILTQELLNMIKTKTIPEKQIFNGDNLFEAIDGKNFKLALSLSTAKTKNDKHNNAIFLLLNNIVTKSNELTTKTKNEEKNPKISTKETIVQPSSITEASSFTDIINFLMTKDLDNTFKTLRNYLTHINKSDYEFLIVDLIKLSLLENDIAFTKPMTTLTLLSRNNYSFDISTYIQEFYINLSQNKFKEARIYLDIISKGNNLGQNCVITDGLYQVLESSEKRLDNQIKDSSTAEVDVTFDHNKKAQPITINDTSKKQTPNQTETEEKQFLDKKYEELLNQKGAILLKSMDNSKIDVLLEIAKSYPNMVAFSIGDKGKKQIVLRYKTMEEDYVDYNTLIKKGNQAYKEKDYDECIKNYSQLLQSHENPKSIAYSKLGLSYMKQQKTQLAIDYLTIATELAKKENRDLDFSDLILKLKGNIPQEYAKPYFKMTQDDFNYNDVTDYYGIDNFLEINSFIIESELDVETACHQLQLSLEEIDTIKLIYAREFYTQGNYKKGDLFLKSVEQSKNKTDNTKKIFEDIRTNKRFYQNRKSDNPPELVLTLLPHKK